MFSSNVDAGILSFCSRLFSFFTNKFVEVHWDGQVYNQRRVSTCWVYSTIKMFEVNYRRKNGRDIKLSAPYLLGLYLQRKLERREVPITMNDGSTFLRAFLQNGEGIVPDYAYRPPISPEHWPKMVQEFNRAGSNHTKALAVFKKYFGELPNKFLSKESVPPALTTSAKFLANHFDRGITMGFPNGVFLVGSEKWIPSKNNKNFNFDLLKASIDEGKSVMANLFWLEALRTEHLLDFPKEVKDIESYAKQLALGQSELHSVLIVGYHMNRSGKITSWKVVGSWGKHFGDGGTFIISHQYLKHLFRDMIYPDKSLVSP